MENSRHRSRAMKDRLKELEILLECDIEYTTDQSATRRSNHTVFPVDGHHFIVIDRKLSATESKLVRYWLEKNITNESAIILEEGGYLQLSKLQRFPLNLWRVAFKESREDVLAILQSTFTKDVILEVSQNAFVILVSESPVTPAEVLSIIESEALTSVHIITGERIHHPEELHKAYLQLNMLYDLAHKLKQHSRVIRFEDLRFPMLLQSILRSQGKQTPNIINDSELEQTALVFFDHNLNITETAQALFIHRNTLIYRLNKLETVTGYDIRKFNDAISFYLSYLMHKINREIA